MCGRIVLPGEREIIKKLDLRVISESERDRHLNLAPTMEVPVVTDRQPDTLQYFTWSLIPYFSKTGKPDFKMSTFNATIERLESGPMWKPLIGRRHCVVITSGFYEWQYDDPIKKKGGKPHYIRSKEGPFTYMAGLWSDWVNRETGEVVNSCTVITLPANSLMAQIHNTKGRMPAFLTDSTRQLWLDKDLPFAERKQALDPVPDEFLDTYRIQKVGDEAEFDRVTVC